MKFLPTFKLLLKRSFFPGVLCLLLTVGGAASAATYDLSTLITNPSFESGLTGWTYTGAGVNPDTYLTDAEWGAQTWSSSSPFGSPDYDDDDLASYYPGQPWGLNPNITHITHGTGSSGPTTVISAPVGSNFVGSRQDGYQGHYLTGGVPDPPDSFYDTNFQLKQTFTGSFSASDEFNLTVWAVRGRVNGPDRPGGLWGVDNNSSVIRAILGTNADVVGSAGQNFTLWADDGIWASQTFTWTLASAATSLELKLTGQNSNHDRFVAVDIGPVPIPGAVWLLGSGLIGLVAIRRRVRK